MIGSIEFSLCKFILFIGVVLFYSLEESTDKMWEWSRLQQQN
jgi:hypothetical protein